MNIKLRTGFEKITHSLKVNPQSEKRGKKVDDAEHVRQVEEFRKDGISYLIQGKVIRQMNVSKDEYEVKLYLDNKRAVTGVRCTCTYNKSNICKHITALIHFINSSDSVSKTNNEQSWGVPSSKEFSKNKYSKGRYFEQMRPPKKKPRASSPVVCDLLELSTLNGPFGLPNPSHLRTVVLQMQRDQDEVAKEVSQRYAERAKKKSAAEQVLKEKCRTALATLSLFSKSSVFSNKLKLDPKLKVFYEEKIVLSQQDIIKYACDTIEQSKCDLWFDNRSLRISGSSNAHKVKTRVRKSILKLVEEIINPKKVDVASTKYGIATESKAKKKYCELYNVEVMDVGVVVSYNQPWLCVSIDGAVVSADKVVRLLEIKCPSSCKTKKVVDFEQKKCNVKYLNIVNNKVCLVKSHMYYTQCQTMLYVMGLELCDLFVYSPVKGGSIRVVVEKDLVFLKDLLLENEKFYFRHVLPKLYEKHCEKDKS